MSELQIALIALGVVIVAAVVLYNWWQERRLMRENGWRFDDAADDPLLTERRPAPDETDEVFRIDEPAARLDDTLAVLPDAPPEAGTVAPEPRQEPAASAASPVESGRVAQAPAAPATVAGYGELPAHVSEQIDLVGLLAFADPQPAASVAAVLRPLAAGEKLRQCLVQDADGVWYDLAAQQNASALTAAACTLQLADRRGPVSESMLRQFRESVQAAAATLGAALQWRGAEKTLPYAVELDQFGMDVDVMVGFHILPGDNGPFAGTKLRGLAEAAGMHLQDDGAFHCLGEAGETQFTLVSQDKRPFKPETLRTLFYRGLTFQLDVPRVANCSEVFGQMVQIARKLQLALGGQLVDDNQRPLSDADIDKIRQQLKAIQTRMVARGIPPGSATALRLFS